MLALAGWAVAAFWMARFLLWGAPGLLLDPAAGVRVMPWGVMSMSSERHPELGLALALVAGWLLREKGPVLWMAAGLALGVF